MVSFILYGIPNCDTMKKARKWLESGGVAYIFHDYKKQGIAAEKLREWADLAGWEVLLNRRGTTYRKLAEAEKADLDAGRAIALMEAQPSMIKRPVLEWDGGILVGFNAEEWASQLSAR